LYFSAFLASFFITLQVDGMATFTISHFSFQPRIMTSGLHHYYYYIHYLMRFKFL